MSKLTAEEFASLPPAVRKQAEELEAQAQQAEEGMAATAVAEQPPVVAPTEEAPAPEVQNTTPDVALPDVGTPPTVEPQRKPVTTLEQAEQALRVLQGKYDREITRVHADNRELREQIAALSAQQKTRETPPAEETGNGRDISDPNNPYGLTPEETDLGPEILSVAQKVGNKLADEAIRRAMEPIRAQLAQQAERQQYQDVSQFRTDLTGLVPNWETVNEMPEFVEWLGGIQPGTRQTRQNLITEAYEARDASTAAFYFNQFLRETGRQQPKPKASPNVAEQVVPRRGTATPAQQKRTWSLDEWSKAHTQLATGDPNSLHIQELSKELKAAWAEGRVTA